MGRRRKTRAEIARNMGAIRSTGNRTEETLRKALHAAGLRYRKYSESLPGRPDIAFVGPRVAVFVDGDYWHGRLLIEGDTLAFRRRFRHLPREARAYWRQKLTRRVQRDREITARLQADGWIVIRLWESDIKNDVRPAAERIAKIVRGRTRLARQKRAATPRA
jgi:DNA mismatch endonuclease (patch repair protein)